MTVWVDDALIPAKLGRFPARWSHLFASTQAELHDFAASIGLRREWFQPGKRGWDWHYDVTATRRQAAIQAGAVQVAWRDAPRIMRAREQEAT